MRIVGTIKQLDGRKSNSIGFIGDIADNLKTLNKIDKVAIVKFLVKIRQNFHAQAQLVTLPDDKKLVFVGDTHGDYSASMKVVEEYLNEETYILFLGDYIDRPLEKNGDLRNLLYLFQMSLLHKNVILLRGDHEDRYMNMQYGFSKAVRELWDSDVWELFSQVFSYMPIAVETASVIGLHGGLPNVNKLREIQDIPKGLNCKMNDLLDQVLWNDSTNSDKKIIEKGIRGIPNSFLYGKLYFEEVMKRIKKTVLIRGHDPTAKGLSFDGRCVTLHTCTQYTDLPSEFSNCDTPMKGRIIAICSPNLQSAGQVVIKNIDEQLDHGNSEK